MKKSEKIAEINNILATSIAAEKAIRAKAEADYRGKVAVLMKMAQEDREKATDDPEEPQDCDQPTVWLNGKQRTAEVVARRILKKLPKIPYNCAVSVDICHYNMGAVSLTLKTYNPAADEKFTELYLASHMEFKEQAANTDKWIEDAGKHFAIDASDDDAKSLDKMFGGNPLDDFPKIREEDGNE